VLPGLQEVQLVPVVAVARADGHFNAKRGCRDDADAKPGYAVAAGRLCRRLVSRGVMCAGWRC
jgi:hypothetical protein